MGITSIARDILDGIYLGPMFPLRHMARRLGWSHHQANLKKVGPIFLRPGGSDAETFVDIFRRGAYDFSWVPQHDLVATHYSNLLLDGVLPIIIDAGANVGAASLWFNRLYPESRIFAVEPDAENVKMLRLNVTAKQNIKVVEAAIGSLAGRVALSNPEQTSWSIRTERTSEGKIDIVTVPELKRSISVRSSVFLVKVDIEGFEADLFAENLDWLDEAKVVIIEPHDWLLPSSGSSRSFRRAMLDRDFEMILSGENIVFIKP